MSGDHRSRDQDISFFREFRWWRILDRFLSHHLNMSRLRNVPSRLHLNNFLPSIWSRSLKSRSSAKNSSFFYEQKQIHWNRLIILHLNYFHSQSSYSKHCQRAFKPLRHVGKKKRGKFSTPVDSARDVRPVISWRRMFSHSNTLRNFEARK